MIRHTSTIIFATSISAVFAAACGGEIEPGAADTEQAVSAATLRLSSAAGGSTDFGSVILGLSVDRTFVVTNVGRRQTSSALAVTLSGGGGFAIVAGGAGSCVSGTTTLRPAQSCNVRVRLAPATPGARAATLSANASVGGATSVTLTGVGVRAAAIVISPASFAFPATNVGATAAPMTFLVANAGGTVTTALAVSLGGPNVADFLVGAGAGSCANGTVQLAPGASCAVVVSFRPSSAGAKSATLSATATVGGSTAAQLSGSAPGI